MPPDGQTLLEALGQAHSDRSMILKLLAKTFPIYLDKCQPSQEIQLQAAR